MAAVLDNEGFFQTNRWERSFFSRNDFTDVDKIIFYVCEGLSWAGWVTAASLPILHSSPRVQPFPRAAWPCQSYEPSHASVAPRCSLNYLLWLTTYAQPGPRDPIRALPPLEPSSWTQPTIPGCATPPCHFSTCYDQLRWSHSEDTQHRQCLTHNRHSEIFVE